MELVAKFLKLGFPGQSTFTILQKRYLVPAVDEYWTSQQTGIVDEMSDRDLIILGKKINLLLICCVSSLGYKKEKIDMHIVCEQFLKRVSGFQAMAEWTVLGTVLSTVHAQ